MLVYNVKAIILQWRRYISFIITLALTVGTVLVVVSSVDSIRTTVSLTSENDNAVVLRRGAFAEKYPEMSRVKRDLVTLLQSFHGIKKGTSGEPLVSPEYLHATKVKARGVAANVTVRGVTGSAFEIHRSIEGAAPKSGVVLGSAVTKIFPGISAGDEIEFEGRRWKVNGFFTPRGSQTPFDSEIWASADELMQTTRAEDYSFIVAKLDVPVSTFVTTFGANKEMTKEHRAGPESLLNAPWEDAAKAFSLAGRVILILLVLVAGAGSVNLILNNVLRRRRDVAIIRTMGYSRLEIVTGFAVEGILVASLGAVIGVLFTVPLWNYPLSVSSLGSTGTLIVRLHVGLLNILSAVGAGIVLGGVASIGPAWYCAMFDIRSEIQAE